MIKCLAHIDPKEVNCKAIYTSLTFILINCLVLMLLNVKTIEKNIFCPLKYENNNFKSSIGTYFCKIVEIMSTGLAAQLPKKRRISPNAGLGI